MSSGCVIVARVGAQQMAQMRLAKDDDVVQAFAANGGSTTLSAQLDPEDLRELLATYHGMVSEVVKAQGGHGRGRGSSVCHYDLLPDAGTMSFSYAQVRSLRAPRRHAGLFDDLVGEH